MPARTDPEPTWRTDRASQVRLFRLNHTALDPAAYRQVVDLEDAWVVRRATAIESTVAAPASRQEFTAALSDLLGAQQRTPSPSTVFVAEQASREQFRVVVEQFAVDGLTEAQSFFSVVPRLPHRSHLAVLRVLIDEFGCGNLDRSHSQLYRALLAEFGLPTDVEHYVDRATPEMFAFVNLFSWLAARAPQPEYFLGGLAYLEASILDTFPHFAAACHRLGLRAGHYYTEHLHIDTYHSRETHVAIRELDRARGADYLKVWTGALLTSQLAAEALDTAVGAAKETA